MKHKTFLALLFFSAACFAQDDAKDIANLLSNTFDKPDAKIVSQPVVVEGSYAVADWIQDDHGGRALLSRQAYNWKIVSCGGVAISKKETMISAGIPEDQAIALEKKLASAEAPLGQHQIHLFNAFNGELAH